MIEVEKKKMPVESQKQYKNKKKCQMFHESLPWVEFNAVGAKSHIYIIARMSRKKRLQTAAAK